MTTMVIVLARVVMMEVQLHDEVLRAEVNVSVMLECARNDINMLARMKVEVLVMSLMVAIASIQWCKSGHQHTAHHHNGTQHKVPLEYKSYFTDFHSGNLGKCPSFKNSLMKLDFLGCPHQN